jgi:two-component system, NtrC family, sensor kinase
MMPSHDDEPGKMPDHAMLKQCVKLTGASFAVWVEKENQAWTLIDKYGLNKQRQASLLRVLRSNKIGGWLSGGIANNRTRYRQLDDDAAGSLGCGRLYVFPNKEIQMALLVGADQLGPPEKAVLRILAGSKTAHVSMPELDLGSQVLFRPLEPGIEPTHDQQGIFRQVLDYLRSTVSADGGLIALRSGDLFVVKAVVDLPEQLVGSEINLAQANWLGQLVNERRSIILPENFSASFPDILEQSDRTSWLATPIILGQRIIGLVAVCSSEFDPGVADAILLNAGRVAYQIENTLIFSEAARYLQQMALVNELAAAASSGADTDEAARRVLRRLRRVFSQAEVALLLVSSNGQYVREYGGETIISTHGDHDQGTIRPPSVSLASHVIATGRPLRIGDPAELQVGFTIPDGIRSKLVVPLRNRGQVIGILDLSSSDANAFALQDEQLLVMVASHLAGLIENVRLNDETRQRARNLSLIHEVVQAVVGLTAVSQIAQRAAEMMVGQFDFDLAMVSVLHEPDGELQIAGAAGEAAALSEIQGAISLKRGLARQAIREQSSIVVNDLSELPVSERSLSSISGSEMCVPLWEGERTLGAINVFRHRHSAFTEGDLLALQALAGVLTSVMITAERYQQLQTSVRQLEAARETALDISGDLDLDALLHRVVRRARELIGARGAELGLVDEQEGSVRIVVSDNPWRDFTGMVVPFMSGIEGRVAALGEAMVISDYNHWSGRLYPERHMPYKAVAGIPLKLKSQVIGVLLVSDDRPEHGFGASDLQLLEMFAAQVAIFIRNARLYQEIQERMEAQRQAEMQLIRSARLAAVGEMAAGVAHELNNPLTTVAGFIELILDELPEGSSHRKDLELVLQEARRARGVVRRLLDFSRPSDNLRVRSDVNEIVSDVLTLVQHLVRTNGVELRVQLDDELPWVRIDPNQIKQVLLNLVHNALQAMPKGGVLSVRTATQLKDERDWLAVSIMDTGSGIKLENLERIFEPFFTTRPVGSGTGLGLSVSYGIATEHGGYIDVESVIDQGSSLTLWLPVNDNDGT